jgi:hypothetical protein
VASLLPFRERLLLEDLVVLPSIGLCLAKASWGAVTRAEDGVPLTTLLLPQVVASVGPTVVTGISTVCGSLGDRDREQGPWIFCSFLLGSRPRN